MSECWARQGQRSDNRHECECASEKLARLIVIKFSLSRRVGIASFNGRRSSHFGPGTTAKWKPNAGMSGAAGFFREESDSLVCQGEGQALP